MKIKFLSLFLGLGVTLSVSAQFQFTEDMTVPFVGVIGSNASFFDVDNDGDDDVIISGRDNTNTENTKLYLNDGSGTFTVSSSANLENYDLGSVSIADVDGDNDLDILITGDNANTGSRSTDLYTNDGNGVFTQSSNTFEGLNFSNSIFLDAEGDGDLDLIISGVNGSGDVVAHKYDNDGAGVFTEDASFSINGVQKEGFIDTSDVDGDGDVDFLVTGQGDAVSEITELYLNDGNGSFSLDVSNNFVQLRFSFCEFADLDQDGDEDLILTGRSSAGREAKIYENDGAGNFTEVTGLSLTPIQTGVITTSDLDGDLDMDILISGYNSSSQYETIVYRNEGNMNFTTITGLTIEHVGIGECKFADVDGDNDLDLVITGRDNLSNNVAKLYLNETCQVTHNQINLTECFEYESPSGNYNWSSTGIYRDTIQNAAGCDSILTIDLTIQDVNVDVTNLITSASANNTNPGVTYQWLDCDDNFAEVNGATDQSLVPPYAADFAVEVTENGCVDTSNCYQLGFSSIQDNTKELISMYPNPAKDVVNIENTSNEVLQISINDLSGRKMGERRLLQVGQNKIQIVHLPKGIYFIQVENTGKTIRFIKN